MRRRDHDAGITMQVPHGEGQQRCRAMVGEEVDLEPCRDQNPRTDLGELRRVMPGVAGDRARARGLGTLARVDVIREAAGALSDRPRIQNIRSHRIHPASTSASTELEHLIEGVVEHFPAPREDVFGQPVTVGLERRLGQPSANVGRGRGGQFTRLLGLGQSTQYVFGRRHDRISLSSEQVASPPNRFKLEIDKLSRTSRTRKFPPSRTCDPTSEKPPTSAPGRPRNRAISVDATRNLKGFSGESTAWSGL